MNKITMTAGVVALSAASLHAADAMLSNYAPGSQQATKPWSISATLRGFYDDNYATAPKALRRDSFGLEVSPSASLNLIRDQTAFGLSYVYSYRYYENRDHLHLPSDDQSHQVNAKLSHAFTPRFKLDITDSFAVGQEPELLGRVNGTPNATFLRSNGNNIRNFVDASFSAGITDNLTAVLGYGNEYYDYDEEGPNSRSAFLDRTENRGSINLRQVVLPKTVAVAGYQFEKIDYTAPFNTKTGAGSPVVLPNGIAYRSDERNSYAHYFFVGVDQGFTPTLNGSVRGGVQYTKFDNLGTLRVVDPKIRDDQWAPYVDANLTWFYMKDSYAQVGVRHQRAQTDVAFIANNPNLDAESTSVYGSISHRFWGAFVASAIAQYQHSSYDSSNGAGGSKSSEDYLMAGLNLSYEINKFLSTEIGYNYDRLSSDVSGVPASGWNRSYTRNRVYIGIRGTY